MVLAAFLFMKRMAEVTNVKLLRSEFQDANEEDLTEPNAIGRRSVPAGVDVYEVDGPFFFGAADSFRDAVVTVARRPKVLIVRMRRVPVIDSTGMAALRDLATRSQREGTLVILSDVHSQPVIALKNSTVWDELGAANITGNIDDALNRARTYLGLPTEERPAFARPTVARETEHGERRRQPRPPRL